jgi:nicotinate-nucleotide pyrophosphorylase
VRDGLIHRHVLQVHLLIADNHVHVVLGSVATFRVAEW